MTEPLILRVAHAFVRRIRLGRTPLATLDGISLLPRLACAGGAFLLTHAASADASESLDSWVVALRRGSPYIVATGGSATSYDDARDESLALANRALDLFSVKGVVDGSITGVEEEHICWWVERSGVVLRLFSLVTADVEVGIPTLVVTDESGDVVQPPPPQRPEWHESLRFFRLAQITDDLFEAYRNMHLALESILDRLAPQRTGEREGDWFRRALTEASQRIDLSAHAPPQAADPVDALHDDLYRQRRTALFHAKGSRSFLLPHERREREAVRASLRRATAICLALFELELHVRRPRSGITDYFFGLRFADWPGRVAIAVTDDRKPFDPADTDVNPTGGALVWLRAKPARDHDRPFVRHFIAQTHGGKLRPLDCITRVAVCVDGVPVSAGLPEGELVVRDVKRFEALMAFRARNVRQPKSIYSS